MVPTTVDLTALSATFPELSEPQVSRDALVSLISDKFRPGNKFVVVQGSVGSGKTTLLAQFAKTFPEQCFSFFAGTTLQTSHPASFLLEMCAQMGAVLGKPTESFDQLGMDELTTMYIAFRRGVAQEARRSQRQFYFVIDGLEWIAPESEQGSIVNLLPEPRPGICLLASSEIGRRFPFEYDRVEVPPFSAREAEFYLSDLALSVDEVKQLNKACHGVPGYVSVVRRQIASGVTFQDLVQNLPDELRGFHELEWKRMKVSTEDWFTCLSVLAFSKEPLTVEMVEAITKQDRGLIKENLGRTPFLRVEPKGKRIGFDSEAFRQFVADRLRSKREHAESLLIEYYKLNLYNKSSLVILPAFLARPGRYDQLKALVSTDYLKRAFETSKDISQLRHTLELAADQAYEAEDWNNLQRYTLSSSVLRTISARPVAASEVEALLELGEFREAFQIANQAHLAEDRLQLIAMVSIQMQHKGLAVPENVIQDLEQMAKAIDPLRLRERTIEIAASLFELLPNAAIDLVERGATGVRREQSLDLARLTLAMRLEDSSAELLDSRISDQTLQDFARARSPRASRLTAREILAESARMHDTGSKLSLLASWCDKNRTNILACDVVIAALEIIATDPSYGTSPRLLRRLSEPLKVSPPEQARKLIDRIDLLKSAGIKTPAEELVRLEMVLATVEGLSEDDRGTDRLLEAYYFAEKVEDLDERCLCLARILTMLPEIDRDDRLKMYFEIEHDLIGTYNQLLDGSADHLYITRRMLKVLTPFKPDLAINFASRMNGAFRRDRAFQEIALGYADLPLERIDFSTVGGILSKIIDPTLREVAIVQLARKFSHSEAFVSAAGCQALIEHIEKLTDPRKRAYGLAFALKGLCSCGGVPRVDLCEGLQKAVEQLDGLPERVGVEFALATIVARTCPEFSRTLLEKARADRSTSPLVEEHVASMYVSCLQMAIRSFSGIIVDQTNYQPYKKSLLESVRQIHSLRIQCELVAEMALFCQVADKPSEFKSLMKDEVLPRLAAIDDPQSKALAKIRVAACLFEYDSDWALEQLQDLTVRQRDQALTNIATFLFTRCLTGEPVDLESFNPDIDLKTARQICRVIEKVGTDSVLYVLIDQLIRGLIRKDLRDSKRDICKLIEREALEIAGMLDEIAKRKLPDKNNIKHEGFLVSAQACIARLRASAYRRASQSPEWGAIAENARKIPNIADRVIAFAWIADAMHRSEPTLAQALLSEAERLQPSIQNSIDRVSRLLTIARTMKRMGRNDAVKTLLQDTMTLLKSCPWGPQRDQITDQVINMAHSLDPDFAATLTPLIDNPITELNERLQLDAKAIQHDPQRIDGEKDRDIDELQYVISKSAVMLLETLNSRTGTVRHPRDIAKWLRGVVDAPFPVCREVMSCSIQNTLLGTKQPSAISGMYKAVMDSLELCLGVGTILNGSRAQTMPLINLALPKSVLLFHAGDRSGAMESLYEWLSKNVDEYLKIYDPYFSASDMEVLKQIAPEVPVYIISTWTAQKSFAPGDRRVEEVFRKAWVETSNQVAPWTQITLVGTKSGNSPLHNRYVVTKGKGLSLSTSVGGLGLKDSEISILQADAVVQIEEEFVEPHLRTPFRIYRDEPLIVHVFLL